MSDYTELKRLAEAAPEGPWFGPEYAPGTSYVFDVDLGTLLEYQSIDSEKDACLRYVAAANPAAVLALVAENDRLEIERAELWRGKRDVEATRDTKSAVIAELKSENEALRKDAERYRYMRENSQFRNLNGPGLYWYLPRFMTGGDGDQLDRAIDSAIGKGEQS